MARGVPYAFHRRGRKNMRPPVQRDSHVYRDMSAETEEEAPAPVPEPKPEPKPEPVVLEDEPTAEEEPELSMKNTKAEMLAVAEAMGLDLDENMVKKDILAAINDA